MTVHRSSSSPRALTVSRAFRLIVGPEVDELPPAIVVEPPEQPLDPLMIESIPTPVDCGGERDDERGGFDGVVERGEECVVCGGDGRRFPRGWRRRGDGVVGAGGNSGV